MTWDEVTEAITEKLNQLSKIDGIEIELCGSWIWVAGDTYPVKDELKALGFKWARRKEKWHWTPLPSRSHKKSMSMEWIREKHGSVMIGEEA